MLTLVYFFLWRYDTRQTVLPWLTENLWYVGFVAGSIFAAFWVYTSNIFHRHIWFSLIILSHFVVGGWVFTQNKIDLSLTQTLIITGLLWLSILVTRIQHWIKYVLFVVILGSFWTIVSLTWIPLYEQAPDIDGFLEKQEIKLYISSNEASQPDALLTIQTIRNKKEYPILLGKQEMVLDLEQEMILSFASRDILEKTQIRITLPHGSTILLPPQAAVSLKRNEHNSWHVYDVGIVQGYTYVFNSDISLEKKLLNINIDRYNFVSPHTYLVKTWVDTFFQIAQKWKIFSWTTFADDLWGGSYFLSGWNIVPIYRSLYNPGKFSSLIGYNKQLYEEFKQRLTDHLVEQIGWNTAILPLSRRITKLYLQILFSLDSNYYAKNLLHFYQFQKYLEIEEEESDFDYAIKEKNIIEEDVRSRAENWIEKTKMFKYYENIKEWRNQRFAD